ncbi:MAG TPA: hypothetical protein VFY44_12985 [Thermoleophilaceae bacterium]|nr:hypothetical protein [Thermoleophilaceae bacterium]
MSVVRKECKQCGVHTFRSQCGNCGSTELRAVGAEPETPARFVRRDRNALSGIVAARGLRSGGVL